MRLLGVLALLTAAEVAAAPAPYVVLVGGYQALGVDPKQVQALEAALRSGLGDRPVTLVTPEDTDKIRKGLGLCGEDAACIGSIGERAGAHWVLGYGVAKVGAQVLVNLLWVDVLSGKTAATASKKSAPTALAGTAAPLLAELLKDVELKPPAEVPPAPPTPPPAVLVPAEAPVAAAAPAIVEAPPGRPFRTLAIGTGVGTGVLAISATILGVLARGNYQTLTTTPVDLRADGIRRQRNYNLGADASLGVAVAAGVATVVFLVVDQLGQSK